METVFTQAGHPAGSPEATAIFDRMKSAYKERTQTLFSIEVFFANYIKELAELEVNDNELSDPEAIHQIVLELVSLKEEVSNQARAHYDRVLNTHTTIFPTPAIPLLELDRHEDYKQQQQDRITALTNYLQERFSNYGSLDGGFNARPSATYNHGANGSIASSIPVFISGDCLKHVLVLPPVKSLYEGFLEIKKRSEGAPSATQPLYPPSMRTFNRIPVEGDQRRNF